MLEISCLEEDEAKSYDPSVCLLYYFVKTDENQSGSDVEYTTVCGYARGDLTRGPVAIWKTKVGRCLDKR